MKSPRLWLLLLLTSLSGWAHEARVNPDQRRAIQEQLRRTGCLEPLAALSEAAPPPATRGLRRGPAPTTAESLPLEALRYDQYFSHVIGAEFGLPYGRNDDPPSHHFFRNDPHEAPEKLRVLKELGVAWGEEGAPTSVPTWMTLAQNYRNALKARGIDPKTTFVPALVFYRELPAANGKKPKREYLFVDPVTESFPPDISTWKALNKDVEFNIPFAPIFEAMQKGKFPLLDATHDISHFVSFLRFPEFAQAVRTNIAKVDSASVTPGFKGREYWLTEAMSLPDPQSGPRNQRFLKSQGRPTEARDIPTVETELRGLSDQALIDYAYASARHLESQLRDVSGGNSNPAEKWYYLSESFGMRASDLMTEDLSRSQPIDAVLALGKVYFEGAPVNLNANPKALTNETATFNFNTFAAAQKLLALSLREGKLGTHSRKEALEQLRHYAARTEYVLAHPPFTYRDWAEGFLVPNLSSEQPLATYLDNVFHHPTVTQYYLGPGAPRPPKP